MDRRPFISKRIDELEQMFKGSGTDFPTLKGLENELVHRSTPRAVGLLRAVKKNLLQPKLISRTPEPSLFGPPPLSAMASSTQPRRTTPLPELIQKPSTPIQPASPPQETGRPVVASYPPTREGPIPSPAPENPHSKSGNAIMSAEEACKVLQVAAGAAWEAIEQARRFVVQKSNPSKIRSLPLERQRTILEQARRANTAAQILFSSHIHGRPHCESAGEGHGSASEGVLGAHAEANR